MTEPTATGRRGFLRSACRHCLGFSALGLGLPGRAQAGADGHVMPARFARPAVETDEGGLWALMDREETRLRRSSFAVRDEGLASYLLDLVCRLGGEHCPDIRVHVVRTSHFNASMAPNGMMQVWSGLLLRLENEAQLAAVMGHELGHYLERHTLERLRDAKNRAAFGQFLGMFGLAGAIAQLGVLASMFAFSREQEQRADRFAMQLLQRAGYDGTHAARVWENLLGELKITGGEDAGKRSPMMATHPAEADRRDELLRLAGNRGGRLGAAEYQRAIAPHRLGWLMDEIRRGQFEESIVLFTRLLRTNEDDAQTLFARGEVYRLRGNPGDQELALDDLVRAANIDRAPAETFRSLGLVHRRRSDGTAATAAFERYLALAPEAPDAGLITTYRTETKP
jgi:hypothetical protein